MISQSLLTVISIHPTHRFQVMVLKCQRIGCCWLESYSPGVPKLHCWLNCVSGCYLFNWCWSKIQLSVQLTSVCRLDRGYNPAPYLQQPNIRLFQSLFLKQKCTCCEVLNKRKTEQNSYSFPWTNQLLSQNLMLSNHLFRLLLFSIMVKQDDQFQAHF